MNKTAIKNYAIWARVQLIESCKQRAYEYGIAEDGNYDPNVKTIGSHILTEQESEQRNQLIDQIRRKGYAQVMEEAAYTWFNRFIALRFMEVNGYLPSKVRVFTDETGAFKPEILKEAMNVNLEGIDKVKVIELLEKQANEELYKYLLITQCNALSEGLPHMFEKISNWTELLFPANILRNESVISQMVISISEEDWTDQVQIIGWLYQFYNTEPKAKAISHRGEKISKEELPAATQLFTPSWIVHYMVENSLGRLWKECNNSPFNYPWRYYVEEAEQEQYVISQIEALYAYNASLKPEDIKCIDPCMGSGHILCVIFDCLIHIYESVGYSIKDAVSNIVEKNLWGLDVDERAVQLAYFAVMMKARQYDRNFLKRGIQPHVYSIEESNDLIFNQEYGKRLLNGEQQGVFKYLIEVFKDSKEYGSLLKIKKLNYSKFTEEWSLAADKAFQDLSIAEWYLVCDDKIIKLANQAKALSQDYHVVVTNPPYLGVSDLSPQLGDYLKREYAESKADLFSAFIERCISFTKCNGYCSMITMHSWMFLSSFENLRKKMESFNIVNMIHLGAHAFEEISGEVVQTTSFVVRKSCINNYKGKYFRLTSENSQKAKEVAFLEGKSLYISMQDKFKLIPGAPVAYWVQKGILNAFEMGSVLGDIAEIVTGMSTGNNDLYLRLWPEVDVNEILGNRSLLPKTKKWVPYNKGGEARKWFGNNDYIVKWSEAAHFHRSRPTFSHLYFKQGITWSFVTSGMFSARFYPDGFLWDVAGSPCVISDENLMYYTLGYLSTKIANQILKIINPTINCQVVDMQRLPIIIEESKKPKVIDISRQSLEISREDWDCFETAWGFRKHPLV